MSYWKTAGITYLQYISQATSALRQAVKPASANKYLAREEVSFKQQLYKEGKPSGERVLIKVDNAGAAAAEATPATPAKA